MTDTAPEKTTVSITVNGRSFEAQPGRMLIDACEDAGEYIPRFCYHPRMTPVGMCRMCLVEVDTGRGPGLQPSCMITVSPDMVVDTESAVTKRAQDGVLELLLINHPLDCPVCDKGGECPLQDQTMAYGPGESRFVEEKRHFEKPIPISDTVYLDRERCILCDRCTRFADEVAGDPLIHFMDRGNQTQVNTFPDEPFSSYFSGNVVQICPVGALTAKPYRFKARPWDLEEVESTFPNAMGDRIAIQSSRNEVLRYQGVDSDAVNWGWLADRDRFSYEMLSAPTRVTEPLVRGTGLGVPKRDGAELVATTWGTALGIAASAIKQTLASKGAQAIAVLGGARLTNEAQYAWAKLAKGIIRTDNVDAQLADGLPAELVLGLPRSTVNDACAPGGTVVLMSGDPKEELGTLYLRLRHAAIKDNVTIIELTPTATGLSHLAKHSLRVLPGDLGPVARALVSGEALPDIGSPIDADQLAAAAAAIAAGPVTVIAGRASLAESMHPTVEAIEAFRTLDGARFLPALRRGNVMGAIEMGFAPNLLPGGVDLAEGRSRFGDAWGHIPLLPGLDATGILQSAVAGGIDCLILLGSDPLADFPDRELARNALQSIPTTIVVDLFANESAAFADVILPAAAHVEVAGSHTNIEGRVTAIRQKTTPPGTARSDWMTAAELAFQLDADLGLESVDDIAAEIVSVSDRHAGLDITTDDRDGVLVPVADAPLACTWTAPDHLELAPAVGHRLVIDRTMFDQGTVVTNSAAISHLGGESSARLGPDDATELGLSTGTMVRVASDRGSIKVPVTVDPNVPSGVVAIAANHAGANANELVDISQAFTYVTVEAL